jgi:hypothetical protein
MSKTKLSCKAEVYLAFLVVPKMVNVRVTHTSEIAGVDYYHFEFMGKALKLPSPFIRLIK